MTEDNFEKKHERREKIPSYLTDIEDIFRFNFQTHKDFNSSGGINYHIKRSIEFIQESEIFSEEEQDQIISLLDDESKALKFASNSRNSLVRLS